MFYEHISFLLVHDEDSVNPDSDIGSMLSSSQKSEMEGEIRDGRWNPRITARKPRSRFLPGLSNRTFNL